MCFLRITENRENDMTKKLYLNDTYLLEAHARVLERACDERGPYLLLDQTIFYPQGGGQPCDQGTIISGGRQYQMGASNFHD